MDEPEMDGAAPASCYEEQADRVSHMEVMDSSILRAAPACQVLQCGATALKQRQDLYSYSVSAQKIHEFWSHSRHGNMYLKVLLLLLLYNGPAAVTMATLSAFLMMCLEAADILPGLIERTPQSSIDELTELMFAPWATLTGGVVFFVLLFAWRSRGMVFFDQACIHQENEDLKAKAVLNLGGILKYSERLLIVWDETYASCLWCMLELGAFVTCHAHADNAIRIRATAMGPCVLVMILATWVLMMQWTVFAEPDALEVLCIIFGLRWGYISILTAYLRAHHRNTEMVLEQLAHFKVEDAKCFCCSSRSCYAQGGSHACDREIISRCIENCSSSVAHFEEMVRSRVRMLLYRQLGGVLFPYTWQLIGSAPLLWGFADLVAARLRAGSWSAAGYLAVAGCGFTWWFVFLPCVFQVALVLARYFRRRATTVWLDQVQTILVAFLLTVLSFVGNGAGTLVTDLGSASLWCFGCTLVLVFGATRLMLHFQLQQLERKLSTKEAAEERYTAMMSADLPVLTTASASRVSL